MPQAPAGARSSDVVEAVRTILADVRDRGDAAVRELTERFDGVRFDDLAVSDGERKRALEAVPTEVRDAPGFTCTSTRMRQWR